MLRQLSITDLAIVGKATAEFAPGLNVVTGETGAGKSILIDAVGLALGGRSDVSMVRNGSSRAVVDAVFELPASDPLFSVLAEAGFDPDPGEIVLSREVYASGRSVARVCGRPATLGQVKAIADCLIDIHGQHDHQSLLLVSRHRELLDEWGGSEILNLRDEVSSVWSDLDETRKELQRLEAGQQERARLIDLYTFQAEEIRAASLEPGEEEAAEAALLRLEHAERLIEASGRASELLQAEEGAISKLAVAAREISDVARFDSELEPIAESLQTVRFSLEETARDLVRYAEHVEADPERKAELEGRLDLIRQLKRKYGQTIADVIAFGDFAALQLEELRHSEARSPELSGRISSLVCKHDALCASLSELRARAAASLEKAVVSEMADLGMGRGVFRVQSDATIPGPLGAETIEFLFSANSGEPARPLARIASGGEMSRLMLAFKGAMARRQPLPTLIFDEIDAGIGGRAAGIVAEKLSRLSKYAQVLCVTHLAPIAGRADWHLHIEKTERNGRTEARLTQLSPEQRVGELARMLAGANVTHAVVQHARELLQVASS